MNDSGSTNIRIFRQMWKGRERKRRVLHNNGIPFWQANSNCSSCNRNPCVVALRCPLFCRLVNSNSFFQYSKRFVLEIAYYILVDHDSRPFIWSAVHHNRINNATSSRANKLKWQSTISGRLQLALSGINNQHPRLPCLSAEFQLNLQ